MKFAYKLIHGGPVYSCYVHGSNWMHRNQLLTNVLFRVYSLGREKKNVDYRKVVIITLYLRNYHMWKCWQSWVAPNKLLLTFDTFCFYNESHHSYQWIRNYGGLRPPQSTPGKSGISAGCSLTLTCTVSPKRKYTLLPRWVLKIEGAQMKGRGCAKPTIELVQTGPSLILKFKEMAWSSLDQLNCWCVASPTFPLAPLGFEYLALPQVYTFFRWRL